MPSNKKDDDANAVDAQGLPVKSAYGKINPITLYPIFNGVLLAVGMGVTWYIFTNGSTGKYQAKISTLATHDLGWLFLATAVLHLFFLGHSMLLGDARKKSRVNVPDQQVYKLHGATEKVRGPSR